MFSLVIAVTAIALVVAVVAATGFYGGSGMSDAQAQTEATRLKNEEQQIMAAVDSFNADSGRYPSDIQELLSGGYLSSTPRGWSIALAAPATPISMAHADGVAAGWSTPEAHNPVFETASNVPAPVCAKYNLISRGDDGILKQAFTSLRAQCFGIDGNYRVVIHKGGKLASALSDVAVLDGDLPPASGTVFWDKAPSGEVKVATDPGKTPVAKLNISPAGNYDFGLVQTGQVAVSTPHAVLNKGNIAAEGVSISTPGGFELASSNCGSTLSAGSSCSFTVKFTPAREQPYSGTLIVRSSNTSAVDFNVSGNGAAASASLSIDSFGLVASGSTATKNATFTNTGVGPLTIGTVSVSGQGFSLDSTNCSGSLAASASCTAKVKFAAQGTAAQSGLLQIQTVEAGLKTANLHGQSHQSVAVLISSDSAGLADWYQPGVVTTPVTYLNAGNTPMTLLSPALSAPLSVSANTCSDVAPDASCTITVALTRDATPGGAGTQSFVPSGAGVDANPVNVSWSIYSTIPTWSSAAVDFGDVQTGESSTKSINLTNAGSVAANWAAAIPLPAGFSADLSACSNVAPGGSCVVNVTFSPTQAKPYSASGLSPTPASLVGNTLSLTGNSVAAQFTQMQSAALATNLTPWTNSGRHVHFRNTGLGPVKVTAAPSVSGTIGIYSPATSGYCGALPTLQPGEECNVYIQAHGAAGTYSGTVTLASTAGTLSIAATGTVKGGVAGTPTDFGSVQSGQTADRSVQVTNTADYPVYNLSPSAAAPYQVISGGTCNSTLAAGATCTVNVRFSPTEVGATSGAVLTLSGNYKQITNDAESETVGTTFTQTAALTGTGLAAPTGAQVYTTPGTFYWTVPAGVTSVSAVVVGSGQNGGKVADSTTANTYGGYGGALRWRNAIAVTPGTQITVTVGQQGQSSAFGSLTAAGGAYGGGDTGSSPFDANTGGGNGGAPGGGNIASNGTDDYNMSGSGGGAGGYTGNGGQGAHGGWYQNWGAGAGGAGNGGGNCGNSGGGGGGVGLLGPSAAANTSRAGGSGGAAGLCASYGPPISGGLYGGGGGGGESNLGGIGAVRIIWGPGRSFPNNAQ